MHFQAGIDVGARNNANGVSSISPGLRGTSYPGKEIENRINPNGVASVSVRRCGMQPRRGWESAFHNPRVGAPASRQPWAEGWNAVGVHGLPMGATNKC